MSNANAAASTLFLGHNGEWWDFWLIVSVILAALIATAIGVTTAGSMISHKREAAAAEQSLNLYKLETGKNVAEANVRAAEATQRAAEAQLALEQFKAPRRLTNEQKVALAERMKAFPNTAFAMAVGGPGSVDFAIDIADALTAAGWRWIPWPLGGIGTNPPGGRPQMGLDMMRGIETHIFDEKLEPLATEFFHGLTDAGYKNHWVLLPNTSVAAGAGFATPVIIIIGSKE